jgi:hypothetical protein
MLTERQTARMYELCRQLAAGRGYELVVDDDGRLVFAGGSRMSLSNLARKLAALEEVEWCSTRPPTTASRSTFRSARSTWSARCRGGES